MMRIRWWRLVWLGLIVVFVASCGEDEPEEEDWNCWLGRTNPDANSACTCHRAKLEPYEGSSEVGTSCAQSADTNFLCCVGGEGGCTCFYESVGAVNSAALNEKTCGASVRNKVPSCPHEP